MRRAPRPGKYPEFPSSSEDSQYTPSKTAEFIGKVVFVIVAVIFILGLCALVLLMVHGIVELGSM